MMAGTKVATLGQLLATRARATFPYRVNFDDQVSTLKMESWCTANCKGIWRSHTEYATYYQFQEDTDAIMFMLKFGGSRGVS